MVENGKEMLVENGKEMLLKYRFAATVEYFVLALIFALWCEISIWKQWHLCVAVILLIVTPVMCCITAYFYLYGRGLFFFDKHYDSRSIEEVYSECCATTFMFSGAFLLINGVIAYCADGEYQFRLLLVCTLMESAVICAITLSSEKKLKAKNDKCRSDLLSQQAQERREEREKQEREEEWLRKEKEKADKLHAKAVADSETAARGANKELADFQQSALECFLEYQHLLMADGVTLDVLNSKFGEWRQCVETARTNLDLDAFPKLRWEAEWFTEYKLRVHRTRGVIKKMYSHSVHGPMLDKLIPEAEILKLQETIYSANVPYKPSDLVDRLERLALMLNDAIERGLPDELDKLDQMKAAYYAVAFGKGDFDGPSLRIHSA